MTREEFDALPPDEQDRHLAKGWTETRVEKHPDGSRTPTTIKHSADWEASIRRRTRLQRDLRWLR